MVLTEDLALQILVSLSFLFVTHCEVAQNVLIPKVTIDARLLLLSQRHESKVWTVVDLVPSLIVGESVARVGINPGRVLPKHLHTLLVIEKILERVQHLPWWLHIVDSVG